MSKVIWFDTETTGTDAIRHGIHQLAAIIEIDGKVQEKRNFYMNPVGKEYDPGAYKAHGKSLEVIQAYPDVRMVKKEIETMLGTYVNRYDKTDKFIPAGYNADFDLGFFSAMWKSCGDDYFFSWIGGGRIIDPFRTLGMLEWAGLIPVLDKTNLSGVCKHFGITIAEAHNAESDIEATRDLSLVLREIMRTGVKVA